AREMEDVFRAAVPTQGFSFTPHAPYSISAALYAFLNEATAGKIISMHNQETPAEDELSEKGTGPFLDFYKKMGIAEKYITSTNTRSLKNWLPKFNKQQRIIAVHNTHTLMGDIDFVKNEGKHIESFSICLCPN